MILLTIKCELNCVRMLRFITYQKFSMPTIKEGMEMIHFHLICIILSQVHPKIKMTIILAFMKLVNLNTKTQKCFNQNWFIKIWKPVVVQNRFQ